MTKIGVLGAGTWGMALARMLCVSGNEVTVWSALPQEIDVTFDLGRYQVLKQEHFPGNPGRITYRFSFTERC